jgi:hypothetical protein
VEGVDIKNVSGSVKQEEGVMRGGGAEVVGDVTGAEAAAELDVNRVLIEP